MLLGWTKRWIRPAPLLESSDVRALGLDLGSRRVGVAVSNSDGTVATPVTTLIRRRDAAQNAAAVAKLLDEWEAEIVVVGLPLSLNGGAGPAARMARAEIRNLRRVLSVPVVSWDERLTTVIAERRLAEQQVKRSKRRQVVDQLAAMVILQSWLDAGMPRD